MAQITATTHRHMDAPPAAVYAALSDYTSRPAWLPPQFSDFRVEEGGNGAGTVVSYRLKVGPRERAYRMQASEPEPGRTLVERDQTSTLTTDWTVTPDGSGSQVRISTSWTSGASGIGGFMERTFAPRGLKSTYDTMLQHLAEYVQKGGS